MTYRVLSHEDAVRAHALVSTLFVGKTTRYNNKRSDHRTIKWVVPYRQSLKRAQRSLKRVGIPFDLHFNYGGEVGGISIRVPLDFVAPADPHAVVKANAQDTLTEALMLVLDLAKQSANDDRDEKAIALVAAHVNGMKKAK